LFRVHERSWPRSRAGKELRRWEKSSALKKFWRWSKAGEGQTYARMLHSSPHPEIPMQADPGGELERGGEDDGEHAIAVSHL
jgi:hypothetical protein